MTASPVVDVVVAVHDPRRRLDRALQSLAEAAPRIRVTVVCHGIAAAEIAGQLPDGSEGWVRTIEFADGVRSPAGPFNRGLREATAEYVMIMGSDDFLEPGAMDAWIDATLRDGGDIQIAPLRYQGGQLLANPLTRPWRRQRLDPVRDRLFHRSAPLALIRRRLVGQDGPLSSGMPVGEDLAWSSALWTSGARIAMDPGHPAYVIADDDSARVTMQPRPLADVLAPLDALLGSEWARRQSPRVRVALAAKLLRVNIGGALRARPAASDWTAEARGGLTATMATLTAYAPRGGRDLPRADRLLLDTVGAPAAAPEAIAAAIATHARSGRFARLIPRNPFRAFGRESVLRRYARYLIDRRR